MSVGQSISEKWNMPARYCCLIHWKVDREATDEWRILYVVQRYYQFTQKFILTNAQKSSKNVSCIIYNRMSLLSLFPSHTYHTHSLRQRQLLMKKYFLVPFIQPVLQICIQQSTSNLSEVTFSNCMNTHWRKEILLFLRICLASPYFKILVISQ